MLCPPQAVWPGDWYPGVDPGQTADGEGEHGSGPAVPAVRHREAGHHRLQGGAQGERDRLRVQSPALVLAYAH